MGGILGYLDLFLILIFKISAEDQSKGLMYARQELRISHTSSLPFLLFLSYKVCVFALPMFAP